MFSNRWPIIVCYAVALHYVQALALLFDKAAAQVTAIHTVERVLGNAPELTAAIFVGVATLALAGLIIGQRWTTIALMLPQQFLLFLAAFGALDAIVMGRFADGVERPHAFLIADQSPAILAAIGHTVAILALIEKRTWR